MFESENVIFIFPFRPVESALLTSSRDSAGEDLINVDVFHAIVILIMLNKESECSQPNCLSLHPTDALCGKDVVGGVTEGLVLPDASKSSTTRLQGKSTNHNELSSDVEDSELGRNGHGMMVVVE
ncbi:lccl domain containing protein, partial [Moniliophthora roreri]